MPRCEMPTVSDPAHSLVSLYEISKLLGASLNLDQALRDVLNILSSYMQMGRGAVVLLDAAGKPQLTAQAGAFRKADGYPFAAVQKVIATSIPIVAVDMADEPLLADVVATLGTLDDESVSFLCVPIKSGDRSIGALSVERTWGNDARHVFEHDLRFLFMVANMIGQAVLLQRRIAADRQTLIAENARLQKMAKESKPELPVHGLEDVVGNSPAMVLVFSQVQQAAPTRVTVLLRGESGTGKELVARAIHMLSPRSKKPFVSVNCAALSESLLESELFGHEKGAFTGATLERKGRFELAHGGTLFLDEIGEISPAFQAKLLRVLQEGEFERVGGSKTVKVDVRLVAATNRDLEQAVSKGEFRADLYYRINVVPIRMPALRERSGDIPLLASHFLARFNEENNRHLDFTDDALLGLQGCYFPGNVRELENCVCRTATMTRGEFIRGEDLFCSRNACLSSSLWHAEQPARPAETAAPAVAPPVVMPSAPPPAAPLATPSGDDLSERERLIQAMEKSGWVQAKAARLLGLTPRQIGYALQKHGIELRHL